MKKMTVFCIAALFSTLCLADGGQPAGPCKKIAAACEQAGFIKGDWKKGDGLWRDCVNPIIQGISSVPGATKTLPAVDPKDVAACKAKHPKFGSGAVGSESNKPVQ